MLDRRRRYVRVSLQESADGVVYRVVEGLSHRQVIWRLLHPKWEQHILSTFAQAPFAVSQPRLVCYSSDPKFGMPDEIDVLFLSIFFSSFSLFLFTVPKYIDMTD